MGIVVVSVAPSILVTEEANAAETKRDFVVRVTRPLIPIDVTECAAEADIDSRGLSRVVLPDVFENAPFGANFCGRRDRVPATMWIVDPYFSPSDPLVISVPARKSPGEVIWPTHSISLSGKAIRPLTLCSFN